MTRNDDPLGVCPNCGHDVGPASELIEYERSDGSTGRYAECPGCGSVVAPE
jgi:DNA-directed RNA polymerase subunit RPC12/RpoP